MTDQVFVLSSGQKIPVVITTRRGTRHIILRPRTMGKRQICLTKPWLTPTSAALNFLERKRKWVEQIFNRAPAKVHVCPGMMLEFLGRRVTLVHDPGQRGNQYSVDEEKLIIGGDADMFERRVRDFILSEFLGVARDMVHTVPRDLWPRRITVRDTISRWGSCSSTGTISLSWRLAFAPLDVMRYVIMHELAHRRHMDHSPQFWDFVRQLYGFGVERARRWLTQHGGELHQYF